MTDFQTDYSILDYMCLTQLSLQQCFSYIVALNVFGGGYWNNHKKAASCSNSLTNIYIYIDITAGWYVECTMACDSNRTHNLVVILVTDFTM